MTDSALSEAPVHPLSLDCDAYVLHQTAELLPGCTRDVFSRAALERQREQAERKGTTNVIRSFIDAGPRGLWLSRLPETVRSQLNVQAQINALRAAGIELRTVLLGAQLTLTLDAPHGRVPVEIWWGDFMTEVKWIDPEPTVLQLSPPPRREELRLIAERARSPWSPDVLRVIMPWAGTVRLIEIRGHLRRPSQTEIPASTLLIYGSSITMGGNALLSCDTYARIVARRLGQDLINLGFGGGAHLEPIIANYICDQPWHAAICEMGINVRGLSNEAFAALVDAFVAVFEARLEKRPLHYTDLYPTDHDYLELPKSEQLRQIVGARISSSSLAAARYHHGRAALTSSSGLTPDLIHPSVEGMRQIAEFWYARLSPPISSD